MAPQFAVSFSPSTDEETLILTAQYLSRISPSTLFGEVILAILTPTTRSLGPIYFSQLQGAVLGAPMPLGEMTKQSDDNTLITVMIETPKAVENAEAIAAVPGIDCLLIGSSDLSMELGIPGENGHAKIQAAVDKVVAGCKKHGKWPGMGGAYSEELLKLYTGKGMKLVLAGNDLPMLTGAARAHQAKVRAFQA